MCAPCCSFKGNTTGILLISATSIASFEQELKKITTKMTSDVSCFKREFMLAKVGKNAQKKSPRHSSRGNIKVVVNGLVEFNAYRLVNPTANSNLIAFFVT